jgi:hypothetical protein
MSTIPKPILEQCFTSNNWPDAIVEAIEMVGYMKCKHEMTTALVAQWLNTHGTDKAGAAKFMRSFADAWKPSRGR